MQFLRLIFLDENVKDVRISIKSGNHINVWNPEIIEDVSDRMEADGYTKLTLLNMNIKEGVGRNSVLLECRAE